MADEKSIPEKLIEAGPKTVSSDGVTVTTHSPLELAKAEELNRKLAAKAASPAKSMGALFFKPRCRNRR